MILIERLEKSRSKLKLHVVPLEMSPASLRVEPAPSVHGRSVLWSRDRVTQVWIEDKKPKRMSWVESVVGWLWDRRQGPTCCHWSSKRHRCHHRASHPVRTQPLCPLLASAGTRWARAQMCCQVAPDGALRPLQKDLFQQPPTRTQRRTMARIVKSRIDNQM